MDQDQPEQNICLDHMKGKRRRGRKSEKRRQGTVPRNRQQNHSHGYIGEMTCQSNGCDLPVPFRYSCRKTSSDKVVFQAEPPDPNDDTIKTQDPEGNQSTADRERFADNGELSFDYMRLKFSPEKWVEGAQSQQGDGYGEPAVPDDDMESHLEGEKQFTADSGIAVVIRSKGEANGEGKGSNEAPSERP